MPDTDTTRGFFGRLRDKLSKTRGNLADGVKRIFTGHTSVNDEVYEELEEILIQADIGVETTLTIIEDLKEKARANRIEEPEALYEHLKDELVAALEWSDRSISWTAENGPHVTLIAGVNGSGKTTTTGKLAERLRRDGKTVMLAAADTFRAAAADQLAIWSERTGAPLIRHREGADPGSVVYDAIDAAESRHVECVLVDTAGRLHTKVNLMEELKKVQRVAAKRLPGAPHEVLLVLDATTGQNGLQQAKIFTEALNVTGIVIAKLDGTAKGGIAIAIQKQLGIPIKLIGVGETAEDLQPFDPRTFVEALFS